MIDRDLALLYGVENRALKQAVRRNLDKFPDDFMLRLTENESNQLISSGVSQIVIPPGYNTGGTDMFAFTEQGVAMLATVLKSQRATDVSMQPLAGLSGRGRHTSGYRDGCPTGYGEHERAGQSDPLNAQCVLAYIRVGLCLHGRWRIPAPAFANSCTCVCEFLHLRWRMPAQALANSCTGVGRCVG